jgi:hypothetical protein
MAASFTGAHPKTEVAADMSRRKLLKIGAD